MAIIHTLIEAFNGTLKDVKESQTEYTIEFLSNWLETRQMWAKPMNEWQKQDFDDFVSCCTLAVMNAAGELKQEVLF